MNNAYRAYYAGLLGIPAQHLSRCLSLLERISLFELHYASGFDELDRVLEALDYHWQRPRATLKPAASLPG